MEAVRREFQAVDPDLSVYGIRTLDDVMGLSLAQRRFSAQLVAAFGGVAILLAGMGVEGMASDSVNKRTHEIGIRMALGAQKRAVFGMVIRQQVATAMGGIALGLGVASILTRFLSGLLYGVGVLDLATFAIVAAALFCVSVIASYVPARRAATVDPIVALRNE